MIRRRGTMFGLVAAAAVASCMTNDASGGWFGGTRGSGVAATQPRQVGEFRRLEVRGSTDVVVTVGKSASVVVSGDDNLVGQVITEIAGDVLVVRQASGNSSPRLKLLVTVTTPALDAVSIMGSADVRVQGVNGARFKAHIAGSGDLDVAGTTGDLEASISGSGDMRLYGLSARTAQVRIAGSGDVQVHAQQSLQARISGSGDIRYRGDPQTQISVSGSGSVRRG